MLCTIAQNEAYIFYRATARNATQGMVTRKLSIRPFIKRVHCDKTKESSAQIFIPYERTFTLVFRHKEVGQHFRYKGSSTPTSHSFKEWLVGVDDPLYLKCWPTWSVMRSVSDGRWVDVVEGALLQGRLSAGG